MDYYIERLKKEVTSILKFWNTYAVKNEEIVPEVDISGNIIPNAPMGSIYLSRIMYGASAAVEFTGNKSYLRLAARAWDMLRTKLTNPEGGFYWAIDHTGKPLHNEDNAVMAQAFVIYGLSEFYRAEQNPEIISALRKQVDFAGEHLYDNKSGCYFEGYEADWSPTNQKTISFATHLHMLEALVKHARVTKNNSYDDRIDGLLKLLVNKFISVEPAEIIHHFNLNWEAQPNEKWRGHNCEASWILCDVANYLKNEKHIKQCELIAVEICKSAIALGFDTRYGGMFNKFSENELLSTVKEWWPQAECTIAFLKAYRFSGDKYYLSYAIRLLEYIDNTFSDPRMGEWYDSVSAEGMPVDSISKLHLWKSMYHNIRYCIETSKHLNAIFASS